MKIQEQNLLNREYPMVKHEDHEAAMKAKMDQALQIIKKLREKNQTGKALYLDFGADTLLVYGDLELDSAAVLFVNWIQWALWEYECGKLTDKKETQ